MNRSKRIYLGVACVFFILALIEIGPAFQQPTPFHIIEVILFALAAIIYFYQGVRLRAK